MLLGRATMRFFDIMELDYMLHAEVHGAYKEVEFVPVSHLAAWWLFLLVMKVNLFFPVVNKLCSSILIPVDALHQASPLSFSPVILPFHISRQAVLFSFNEVFEYWSTCHYSVFRFCIKIKSYVLKSLIWLKLQDDDQF